jgi:hypothetical protein
MLGFYPMPLSGSTERRTPGGSGIAAKSTSTANQPVTSNWVFSLAEIRRKFAYQDWRGLVWY